MPEIWRFFSPFWVTGPGLGILFDTYFRKIKHALVSIFAKELKSVDLFEQPRDLIFTL